MRRGQSASWEGAPRIWASPGVPSEPRKRLQRPGSNSPWGEQAADPQAAKLRELDCAAKGPDPGFEVTVLPVAPEAPPGPQSQCRGGPSQAPPSATPHCGPARVPASVSPFQALRRGRQPPGLRSPGCTLRAPAVLVGAQTLCCRRAEGAAAGSPNLSSSEFPGCPWTHSVAEGLGLGSRSHKRIQ